LTEFLLHSSRCFVDGRLVEATLHIKEGKIYKVYSGLHAEKHVTLYEYGDLLVIPGVIDAHVHINEPGREDWEGFDTATRSAAIGGITTLIEMPLNASPVTTNLDAFELKKQAAQNKLHVNCGFYGGVIPENTKTNDIESLIKAGVFGIKGFLTHSGIDEFPNVSKEDLEAIAPVLHKYDIPLLLHCELTDTNIPVVNDTKSYQEYLTSRPPHWETNAIELALSIQEKYDIHVHIVHLATSKGLKPIQEHKKKTDKLTVETCPHYLFFSAEEIPDAAPIYKCAPPIREKFNNELLWQAVDKGEIDFISSDHSPAPPERKQLESGDFFKAWGGISGLQYTLCVMNSISKKQDMDIEKLIPLITSNPAQFLGIGHRKGYLKEGYDADITVWDDTQSFILTEQKILHKHKATPYINQKMQGIVEHTFVNGVQVVENRKLKALNKGQLLLKKIK